MELGPSLQYVSISHDIDSAYPVSPVTNSGTEVEDCHTEHSDHFFLEIQVWESNKVRKIPLIAAMMKSLPRYSQQPSTNMLFRLVSESIIWNMGTHSTNAPAVYPVLVQHLLCKGLMILSTLLLLEHDQNLWTVISAFHFLLKLPT